MAVVRGTGGSLRVGYQVAGVLGAWTVTTSADRDGEIATVIEAVPLSLDPYWSRQRPVDLDLQWFGARRRWRNLAPVSTAPLWRFHTRETPEVI